MIPAGPRVIPDPIPRLEIPVAGVKAMALAAFAYESVQIVRDFWYDVRREPRPQRFPTISVFTGRQHPLVRAGMTLGLVGGLFLHLVPSVRARLIRVGRPR